ncbi:site-2 protease family protein [Candidatus Amarolinea aalborgensis]|uniref:site-2 protease family protein n=1 Tax=Candidatus Amarolinea aalborgensis TaxID=2249329 RepID=UPI003BF99920
MSWSFRIAQVFGIDIKIHITFFLILILGAVQWGGPAGLSGAAFGVLLMLLLFTCVTLHELGHSVVALHFGIPVREIILLPLGGVAVIGRNPDKPLHELLIAIAGPLVNVVIAIILLLISGFAIGLNVLDGRGLLSGLQMTPSLSTLLVWLLSANLSLVIFNLIPAFPLDGGRVLRALLAMAMGYPRATVIASGIGQVAAIILGIVGVLSGNFVLALIAIFIFTGAGQESSEAQARTVLDTLRVRDAYNRHAISLTVGDRMSKVVGHILTSYQPDFAVTQGDRLLGIITREDVLRALNTETSDLYVTQMMRRDFVRVNADQSLHEVRDIMSEKGARTVAVYDNEQFLGLVSLEDIAEAFTVLSFVQRFEQRRTTAGSQPA